MANKALPIDTRSNGPDGPARWPVGGNGATAATRSPKRSELIAAVLRKEIIEGVGSGELREGDPLPSERELLARFDVARPTLREAMRILEADSLVEFRVGAKGGAYIRIPDPEVAAHHVAVLLQLRKTTLQDVGRIRTLIEPAAACLAATNRTKEGVATLRSLIDEATALVNDPLATASVTSRFIREMIRQSQSPALDLLCVVLHEILDAQWVMGAVATKNEANMKKLMRLGLRAMEHLTDLIEAGDGDAAGEFWTAHVQAVTKLHAASLGADTIVDAMA